MHTTAAMSVPRKFSEKIAIQRQKAAEQEEAFASIMREVASARHPSVGVNVRHMNSLPSNIMYKGGSLPAFPTPHHEVQNQVGDIIQDLSATFPRGVLYDDQAYRNKQHPSRVLHKPRQRTDSSPYHLPQYQTLRDSGSWRRTFSDPAMGPGPRGSPSPKVSPKEPRSPQSIGKGPDTTQVYGNSMGQERQTHHMKILNNSGSLPDVAGLSLEIPRSPVEVEEGLMKSPHANNNIKFTVPSSIPPRRNLNTGKQVFPRQFSNPDSKEMAKEQQQRFLINQLAQEMQGGNPLHSPTSPASSMAPPFGSISPLAYEAMYTQNSMPNISPSGFEQEQYLNMLRMNELMYEQANKQMPRYDESQQQQQQMPPQQQQPPQHHQQQQQQQQVGMMQANMQNKMMQNRQMNVNQNNDEFASQFRMGITGNPEQRDDISDDILNNIRVGLDPLNFEDYQLLANSNLEVADQNVEEQFRQDRINFP